MIKKYSKSFQDILKLKENFFTEDNKLASDSIVLANKYKQQEKRTTCKNCSFPLEKNPLFNKQGIDYFLCSNCNHLNGGFEDSEEYVRDVYVDEITNYSNFYIEKNKKTYWERVEKIYKPKVLFLLECLHDIHIDPSDLLFSEIGAGAGYFLSALKGELPDSSMIGYEVSSRQVALANNMLGKELVNNIQIDKLIDLIRMEEADVLVMIGVLEHLSNPREVLNEIVKNNRIKFFYLSVPLFSFSVFFELINQGHFNRQLSGGHTHLYTRESIEYFCKEFGFCVAGEWQFGADVMDLFRFIYLEMEKVGANKGAKDYFSNKFVPILDQLQEVLDKTDFSSEIHLLLMKK
ncbi:class I SAM-dependent methyltransferase [Desulfosporosinus sp. SYSU MS00001]|uniref:class I SAM-dependent methyltransferase n=1 Tax=Desulfosporosinus sp. SYSU MS00001 TaxID=3416284 RepID=UPI003CF3309B